MADRIETEYGIKKEYRTHWLKTSGNRDEFVAEASELHQKEMQCPNCFTILQSIGRPVRDGENELTHWVQRHSCGAKLTIFND